MRTIDDIAALEALYGAASPAARDKIRDRLTPLYRDWIAAARFCVLATTGPEGTDASPRGDDGPVVAMPDDRTLLLPDWRGNNRLDSLRNIVRDGRVSLMFIVPGSHNVVRVNGRAVISVEPGHLARFERDGRQPRSVIVVAVEEVYVQCARAILRARLWRGEDEAAGLPSVGELLAEGRDDIDAAAYDAAWPKRARESMW
ncbi:MSMEG_1061 family FMN-dependent PPOX-type flavoprotein [Limimaricola pyoseonensis]|uniref:Pyridoxamine 5'-phosphate oxidase N-terminal domain-containing protein n=1 Tax=Limimaricola pyoseonensis TaxID=521013 RepID=A0A1G7JYT0_9RHOB|nr:MSMEG_1061 family FMN-dependent PPOX-type flavoprotein [Limimaricola pyoseonensis]SDF30093.1 hypothetical protein SAMN04488567_0056 [Limimaricola pyoseonensis]